MSADETDTLWSNPLMRHLAVILAAKVLLLAVAISVINFWILT